MTRTKELRICGRSMEPRILAGDTVIIRQQPDVDSGDIAVVLVGGEEATVKRIKNKKTGLSLLQITPPYTNRTFIPTEKLEICPFGSLEKS